MQRYHVNILARLSRRLYVGVTRDPRRRGWQHRTEPGPGFSRRYRVSRLVFHEETSDVRAAIVREKQIEGWARARKVALIESGNAGWPDLAAGWFEEAPRRRP